MRNIYPFLLLLLSFTHKKIVAQTPVFELGVKLTKEFTNGKNDGAGFGVQAIYKFTTHSGIETGISYKSNPTKYLVFEPPTPQTRPLYSTVAETEKTILIPIAYRYESGIVNISAGSGFHFLLNKKELSTIISPDKTDWQNNSMEILGTASISKSFRVNKSMIIEPEVRYCTYSQKGGSGFQLNLSFRKRFS
jgi:hypothetical protein